MDAAQQLQRCLSALRAARTEPVDLDAVAGVVEQVIGSLAGGRAAVDLRLYTEFESLHQVIEQTRREISAIRADDVRNTHVPTATDELDAVVAATEEATNAIMAAAETLEEVAAGLDGEAAAAIKQAATRIFEACSFQDLSGQRISKVIKTLKTIEAKVEALLATFGDEVAKARREQLEAEVAAGDGRPDAHLLNGPQDAESARSQDEIDALLASFD